MPWQKPKPYIWSRHVTFCRLATSAQTQMLWARSLLTAQAPLSYAGSWGPGQMHTLLWTMLYHLKCMRENLTRPSVLSWVPMHSQNLGQGMFVATLHPSLLHTSRLQRLIRRPMPLRACNQCTDTTGRADAECQCSLTGCSLLLFGAAVQSTELTMQWPLEQLVLCSGTCLYVDEPSQDAILLLCAIFVVLLSLVVLFCCLMSPMSCGCLSQRYCYSNSSVLGCCIMLLWKPVSCQHGCHKREFGNTGCMPASIQVKVEQGVRLIKPRSDESCMPCSSRYELSMHISLSHVFSL